MALLQEVFAHAQLGSSSRWSQSVWARDCTSIEGRASSPSFWCCQAPDASKRDARLVPLSVRRMVAEKLWREFFSEPSQWWDHRLEKVNPRYPDFKHKKTQQSLWLDNRLNPSWVQRELARMAPETVQSHMFAWHARLRRNVKAGDFKETLNLFKQMQREGMILDTFTFVPVLTACSSLGSLEEGRLVHEQIMRRGCESDVSVATCLVDMYAKCGSIEDAWSVFRKMREHNVDSWGAMIGGYVKAGQGLKAVQLFQKMQQEGVEPNAVTFIGVLNGCAGVGALEEGRRVHKEIVRSGCQRDTYVATCLVDMYAKCGSIGDALTVFNGMRKHSVVSWTAMIRGYVKSGQGLKAVELFRKMQQEGVEPNNVTFMAVLNACASVSALEEGRCVHEQIVKTGCELDVSVANCLVDMYAKCGSIGDAWSVFSKIPEPDVVSWTSMIGGYAKSGQGLKAMELLRDMQQVGLKPNAITFIGVLNACASVSALEEGRRVHEQVIQSGCQSDVSVANCLVDMYAKCGSIEDAWNVFHQMRERDVVSWNAMIGGYAMHGHAKKAIGLFKQICREGLEMDGVTFICLLSACSHGGLLKEGLRYFKCMTSLYSIRPTTKHYACMVDLLSRAGRLDAAEEMTKTMPVERDASVWMSLLGARGIHGNIELAEQAAKWCSELDPENASGHVLLSNIYAAAGNSDRSEAIGE